MNNLNVTIVCCVVFLCSRKSDAALMFGRCYVLLLIIQEMD